MHTTLASRPRPVLWTAGDWNAFCGFGTNILVNLLTLTGLLRGVVGLPDGIVFGRILPATATMMAVSSGYYAWLGWRLARATGRADVCALPSGVSVPHLFVVTLVVMLPVRLATGDPTAAWRAGLAWVFVQSFVLMGGGFVAPWVRRVTPRAALLGALAGVSLTFIAMGPMVQMFEVPVIGLGCLAVVLAGWFGGARFGGVPAGLVVVVGGTAVAWGSNLVGLHWGGLTTAAARAAVAGVGPHLPRLALAELAGGLRWPVLVAVVGTAIPFGLYDLVEAMDNVVSAAAAGDDYPTTRVLTADGVVSLIGCLLGCPFVNAVYIGHPGWKAMGGRIGYSAATGLAVLGLTLVGLLPLVIAVVPTAAVAPILVYVGLLIGAQAFGDSPRRHAPAVVIAMLPALAAWAKGLVDNALAAAGVAAVSDPLVAAMGHAGVLYRGLGVLGGGAILSGIVLGATAASVIDRRFGRAAAFCGVGAGLTGLGLMHGSGVGLNRSPAVTCGYLVAAGVFAAGSRRRAAPPGNVA